MEIKIEILEACGGVYARQSDQKLFKTGESDLFPAHEAMELIENGWGKQVEDAPAPAKKAS